MENLKDTFSVGRLFYIPLFNKEPKAYQVVGVGRKYVSLRECTGYLVVKCEVVNKHTLIEKTPCYNSYYYSDLGLQKELLRQRIGSTIADLHRQSRYGYREQNQEDIRSTLNVINSLIIQHDAIILD